MGIQSGWFDLHTHTELCGHARGWPRDYVKVAAKKGIRHLAVTCHMPFDHVAFGGQRMRMFEDEFPHYLERVEEARRLGEELGVEVLTGIEGEYFPDDGILSHIAERLAWHPFDFVLGSVHHHMVAYQEWFSRRGCQNDGDTVRAYFACLRDGAASGLFHSMSHPDVIRLYGSLSGAFDPADFEPEIREAIAAAVENEVCWEVNTSGLEKGSRVEHPDPQIRAWGREMGLKLTIGSDSHHPKSVGRHFRKVVGTLQEEGFEELQLFKAGERRAVKIADLLAEEAGVVRSGRGNA